MFHRDLKPSNVFLVGGLAAASPKLIDFGLALSELKTVQTAGDYLARRVNRRLRHR